MSHLSPRYEQRSACATSRPPPTESAAAMGISRATMAVVVHRATRTLRRVLDEEQGS